MKVDKIAEMEKWDMTDDICRVRLLWDILCRQKDNDKVAVEYKDVALSYKDIYNSVMDKAEHIKNETDSSANIGLFLPSSIDYVRGYFLITAIEKVIVPIEKDVKKPQLCSVIKYCELKVIVTNSAYRNLIGEMLDGFEYEIKVFDLDDNSLTAYGGLKELVSNDGKKNNADEDDVAILLHTSGTTSSPKKVMLTHKNLIRNVESNIESLGLTKDDVCLIVLPMYFGYCNTSQFLTHFYLGSKIVIYSSMFVPDKFLKMISEKKCTNTTCVPSMLLMVLKAGKKKYALDSLRYLCFGGGFMPVDMLAKVLEFFSGVGVVQTYGQTEASPRVSCLMPIDSLRKAGSVGKAIPNVEIKIVDYVDNPVENNQIGEIVVKGANVMKGYYKRPEDTACALRNGWLYTGDLGKIDEEGYLYIVGRKKKGQSFFLWD